MRPLLVKTLAQLELLVQDSIDRSIVCSWQDYTKWAVISPECMRGLRSSVNNKLSGTSMENVGHTSKNWSIADKIGTLSPSKLQTISDRGKIEIYLVDSTLSLDIIKITSKTNLTLGLSMKSLCPCRLDKGCLSLIVSRWERYDCPSLVFF